MEFWVIGHRGSPAVHVENTIPSFARALDEGANAVELDLSLTRDGHGVIWHDWDPNAYGSLARALGIEPWVACRPVLPWGRHRKKTSDLSLAELREHYGYAEKRWASPRLDVQVPTLCEFFEWAVTQPRLRGVFVDLKVPGPEAPKVAALLTELDALVSALRPTFRVFLETSAVEVLHELGRLKHRHAACFDAELPPGFVIDLDPVSAARRAIEHGAVLACVERPYPSTLRPFATHARIVARDLLLLRAHNARSPPVPLEGVMSFTINDEREMRALIRLGVAGIQTDRPGVLRRVADRLVEEALELGLPVMPDSISTG